MGKINFGACISFFEQAVNGTYSPSIGTTVGSGLLLGTNGTGIGDSGISLTMGAVREETAVLGTSLDRGLATFLRADFPTLTFQMPFCGNRQLATATPVAGDAELSVANEMIGLEALLAGAGLFGTTDATPGWDYDFAPTSVFKISCLIHYWGNRLKLKDCQTSLSINYPAGGVPQLTATVYVGSIEDHTTDVAFPTLDYEEQASVAAAKCIGVNFDYRDDARVGGFSDLTIDVAPEVSEWGDTNDATTGFVKETLNRETKVSGQLWCDDTTDDGHEYEQLVATAIGTLDQMDWQVGDAMVDDSTPALAHYVEIPKVELGPYTPVKMGSKAGVDFEGIARGTGSGNNSLKLRFL